MVWGCICGDQIGMLLHIDIYKLEDGMIPSAWAARGLDFA